PAVAGGMRPRELDSRVLPLPGFFPHEPYHTWRRTGFVRILLQTGTARDPKLPDAPTLAEMMDEYGIADEGRRLAQVILSASSFGRPRIAPPGVPPERVGILRDAFMKAARSPDVAEQARTSDRALDPATN